MSKYENLLKELTEAHGAPGFEDEAIEVMKNSITGTDDISYDKLGSLIAKKKGKSDSPRIMIAGHIDEIAFIVKEITSDGFVKFIPLGGWWGHVALAQTVIIKTSKGDIPGVIGSKPPHILEEDERKKVMQLKDMFIDVGTCDGFKVNTLGIKPGDPIIPDSRFRVMGNTNLYMSKAFDNRIGAAAAVAVVNSLKNVAHPNTVYGVGTVQEEVGLRGAGTAAHVIDPDVAIVADVSLATDGPESSKSSPGRLGSGPSINVMDGSMIPNRHLRDFTVKIAERNKIPFHYSSIEKGGTDGGRIHMSRGGVPTIYLGIATRYIHSHTGVIHKKDFENLVKLITEMVKKLDAKTVKSFTRS